MFLPRDMYVPELFQELHKRDRENYPAPSVEELVEIKATEIRQRYAAIMAGVVKPYQQAERETWFTQLKEADEWLADNQAQIPMLSAMAAARGITVATMVAKVKENDALYRDAIGQILGAQQAELDRLYGN